jgi:hypothetical protein
MTAAPFFMGSNYSNFARRAQVLFYSVASVALPVGGLRLYALPVFNAAQNLLHTHGKF